MMVESLKEVSLRECFQQAVKIVLEFPAVVYAGKFTGGALMPVAGVSGASFMLFNNEKFDRVHLVYPTVWNGRKKKVTTSKIIQEAMGECTEWEYDCPPKRESDYEHVIDSVGMALWLAQRDYFDHD